MKIQEIIAKINARWPDEVKVSANDKSNLVTDCKRDIVPAVCEWLFNLPDIRFIGMVTEERESLWELTYNFLNNKNGLIQIRVKAPLDHGNFLSVSRVIHAVDWHEREAEDLFELNFEGHPRLGDFILHDDTWQEGLAPMRADFDAAEAIARQEPKVDWKPRKVVDAPGAFIMPVGPVFSGEAESSHFLLETIGEEIIRALPRLFFKYRGVERSAQGRSANDALLLAERFAGTTAFSHALAFCMGIEELGNTEIPARANVLRVFLAELERFRDHIRVIEGICASTGLAVGASQAAILEERTLRVTGALTGHRYMFGMAVPGGLSRDINTAACRSALDGIQSIQRELSKLKGLLDRSGSFLDRLEEVGIITSQQAVDFGLAGPVARASGLCDDLRRTRPYSVYADLGFNVPCERDGDGYARLRVFFAEATWSVRIMEQALDMLTEGTVIAPCMPKKGVSLTGVETPRGASWQWIRLDSQALVQRYRLMTPSFANWHGFHLSVEGFAFQDFPIIMSTMGLSVAENDR